MKKNEVEKVLNANRVSNCLKKTRLCAAFQDSLRYVKQNNFLTRTFFYLASRKANGQIYHKPVLKAHCHGPCRGL